MSNTRIVLGIEYNGFSFSGWQTQAQRRCVQHCVELALAKIANHPISVQCAGRTDTGVHALEQIVHFDSCAQRPLEAWTLGGNSHLPADIKIIWARPAITDFHARFSAIARFYRYVIYNRATKSALYHQQTTWQGTSLDAEKMHEAAQALIGHHDFSSFRAAGCQSKSPCRTLYFINVYREHDYVYVELSANAFLHHMVRNIVGVLMDIGTAKKTPDWTVELLSLNDRSKASVTAPPNGLFLAGVFYPAHYGVAAHPIFAKLPNNAARFD